MINFKIIFILRKSNLHLPTQIDELQLNPYFKVSTSDRVLHCFPFRRISFEEFHFCSFGEEFHRRSWKLAYKPPLRFLVSTSAVTIVPLLGLSGISLILSTLPKTFPNTRRPRDDVVGYVYNNRSCLVLSFVTFRRRYLGLDVGLILNKILYYGCQKISRSGGFYRDGGKKKSITPLKRKCKFRYLISCIGKIV